jgi:AraC-like DNA-binding protein
MAVELRKDQCFGDDYFALDVRRRHHHQPDSPLAHTHDFHELVVVASGTGTHRIADRDYDIAAGDVYLVLPKVEHSFHHASGLSLVNILYDPEALNLSIYDLREVEGYSALFEWEPRLRRNYGFGARLSLVEEDLRTARTLIEELRKELTARPPGYRCQAAALFVQLICFLSRRGYSGSGGKRRASFLRISGLLSHIERRYSEPMDLRAMGAIAGMSRSTLVREFRKATGASPANYLLRLRIRKAEELLRDTDLNVSQVGFEVGFQDPNYFSRQFKSIVGVNARQYRRKLSSSS